MHCNRTYASVNRYIRTQAGFGGCCLIGPTGPASSAPGMTGPTGAGGPGAPGSTGPTGPKGADGGGASDASVNQLIIDVSNLDASMNQAFNDISQNRADISANTACCERLDASMVQILI